jgi:hypothetical protein
MSLRLDWCSPSAARWACEHWHYSRSISSGKNVYIGVWESGFIGAIIFGHGSGNSTNGLRFGLPRNCAMAELTRVALTDHETPVTRIVAIAMRMISKQSPGLRLIISMADPRQNHLGIIYQAGNWIYTGKTKPDVEYCVRGIWMHHRSATAIGSMKGAPSRPIPAKHRYLMPLDNEIRKRIEKFRKSYPKRAGSDTSDTLANHAGKGGSLPTPALPSKNCA